MTVAAGMMAFSCATDTTDDLGVNLGKGQKTVISVSLEESRTQLGGYDKDAKKYPMYWSAGDKISANGVVSEVAQFTGEQSAVASFEFPANANLTKPYFVTYPAVANAEGDWQVKFAAEQSYTNGTFGNNVSTMYGYSEESLNVQMNHLTGILKIGITGSDDATLTHAQISTVDRKPIAGTFDFTFETDAEGNKVPKLTPTADAVSVINYSFNYIKEAEDGGISPSSAPTYIHVAVPAGTYDELYVTLYALDGGVMYATVKAGDTKPLKAGQVREFTNNIEYTPADVYVVSDAGTLAGVNNNLDKTVVMVADVDMSGVTDWTSIENFAGEFYGNGYAIKGLKAPLFGTTTASVIKGVHLEGVTINKSTGWATGETAAFGALACNINNSGAVVSHCSVSGDITINWSGTSGSLISGTAYVPIASLIGYSNSTQEFSNLTSSAELKLKNARNQYLRLAGVIAYHVGSLNTATHSGVIDFNGGTGGSSIAFIGGVTSSSLLGVKNCINGDINDTTGTKGRISISVADGKAFKNNINLAGVITDNSANIENCHNYGDISFDGKIYSDNIFRCGGIVALLEGTSENLSISNCSNHGDLTLSNFVGLVGFYVGGLVGDIAYGGALIIEKFSNHGNISLTTSQLGSIHAAGCIPAQGSSSSIKIVDGIINRGDVTIATTSITGAQIGGTLGYVPRMFHADSNGDMINSGNVTFSTDTTTKRVCIGGYLAITSAVMDYSSYAQPINIVNTGNIKCTGPVTGTDNGGVGAIVGRLTSNGQIHNAQCFCDVEIVGNDAAGMGTGATRYKNWKCINCKIGGRFARVDSGEPVLKTIWETDGPIDGRDEEGVAFYNVIYGGTTTWSDDDNYDGCSLLKSKDQITYLNPENAN